MTVKRWMAVLSAATVLMSGEAAGEKVWGGTGAEAEESAVEVETDEKPPVVGSFSFENEAGPGVSELPESGEKGYRYFMDQDTLVSVELRDPEPSSGLDRVEWYLYWADAGTWQTVSEPLKGKVCESASIRIPAGFKGWIQVKVSDRSGNCSGDPAGPEGLVLESASFHLMEEHLAVLLPDTEYQDAGGWALYREKVPLRLEASDHFSGIRKVEWQIRSGRGFLTEESGVLEIGKDGSFSGNVDEGWIRRKRDRNLVVELEKNWTVEGDANEVTFWARLTDWSGNCSEREECFSIDLTEPELTVIPLETAAPGADPDYYAGPWRAEVILRDRNLAADKTKLLCTKDGKSYVLPETAGPGNWEVSEDPELSGMKEYRKLLEISGDGDYSVSVCAEDLADRAAPVMGFHFTIDTVPPQLTLRWEDDAGQVYYDHFRKAYLEVRESNFSAGRIQMTGRLVSGGEEKPLPEFQEWEHNGELHSTWFLCREEGSYEISVEGCDRAGNGGNRQAAAAFVIDVTAPELEITVPEGGECPEVFFSDGYLEQESLRITLAGDVNGEQEVRGNLLPEESGGKRFVFEEFPEGREYDDCYTVSVSVEDRAGNRTEKSACFVINRYGSVYVPAASSRKILGTYQREVPEISVTEKNPEGLVEDQIQVRVIRNGAGRILARGEEYQVIRRGEEGMWKEYSYIIDPGVFREEGAYQVRFTSEDTGGHHNDSGRYLKEYSLSFGVDRTPPVIEALNLSGGMPYYKSSMDAVFQISDNLLLEQVEFCLNGKTAESVIKDGKYVIRLVEADQAQHLVVKASDASGNVQELKIDNFVVTRNPLLYWFSFRTLFAGSLVLAAMVLWIVWKKKRNT